MNATVSIKPSVLASPKRLIFLAEAYGPEEHDVFISDVRRLTAAVLTGASAPLEFVSPFVAVEAVWVASRMSGVPLVSDVAAHKRAHHDSGTAFGLFRRASAPLRVLETSSWSYKAAREACQGCDRATLILLANDDWYGGLGDDAVIATRSATSGALALRHELGHVLGDVGEEYDGGDDYSGDNFATSFEPCAKGAQPRRYRVRYDDGNTVTRFEWRCAHWLETPTQPLRAELCMAKWPFRPPPLVERFKARFSEATLDISVAGGLEIHVKVDGQTVLHHKPAGRDRSFASASFPLSPRESMHELTVNSSQATAADSTQWPPLVVCHIQLRVEEKKEASSNRHVNRGAFATFDSTGRLVGYRPTRCDCLMRDVTLNYFCPVCRRAILGRILSEALPAAPIDPFGQLAPGVTQLVKQHHLSMEWRHHGRIASPPALLKPSATGCWQLRLFADATKLLVTAQRLADPTELPCVDAPLRPISNYNGVELAPHKRKFPVQFFQVLCCICALVTFAATFVRRLRRARRRYHFRRV